MSLKQSRCPLLQMTVAFLRDLDLFDYLVTCGIPCDQKGERWELGANSSDYSVWPTWNETIESYDLRTPETWKQAKVCPLSQTWWLLTKEGSKHCFPSRAVGMTRWSQLPGYDPLESSCLFCFQPVFGCAVKAGLKLFIPQPRPSEGWDCKHVLPRESCAHNCGDSNVLCLTYWF